jgi:hypothetical protein
VQFDESVPMSVDMGPQEHRRIESVGHRVITPIMLDALCHKLTNEPWLYRDEMVSFLRDEYEVEVSTSSITRAMQSRRWSKKVTRRVARQRISVLWHLYHYNLSRYRSYHLIFSTTADGMGSDRYHTGSCCRFQTRGQASVYFSIYSIWGHVIARL